MILEHSSTEAVVTRECLTNKMKAATYSLINGSKAMIFGAITNSWKEHPAGHDLPSLVRAAIAQGAAHIELRQTCLGECETGSGDAWRPVLTQLASLVEAFPDIFFNLAMAWPCLTEETGPLGEQFQAALQEAKLVGGDAPHLRIVDPSSFDQAWEKPEEIPTEAMGIASLAREAARQEVTLSLRRIRGSPSAAWPCWCTRPETVYRRNTVHTWAYVPTPPTSCGATQKAARWPSWRTCLQT